MNQPMIVTLRAIAAAALAFGMLLAVSSTDPGPTVQRNTDVADGGVPRVVVDQFKHVAGRVRHCERIEHRFWMSNRGNADLIITRVETGCECTSVGGEVGFTVRPGDVHEVHAVFDTTRFRAPSLTTLTLWTNDPATPTVNLEMRADVIPIFEYEPVIFIDPEDRAGATHTFRIRATGTSQIQSVRSTSPQVEAVLAASSRPSSREWSMLLKRRPGAIGNLDSATLIINTTSVVVPEIRVPIRPVNR